MSHDNDGSEELLALRYKELLQVVQSDGQMRRPPMEQLDLLDTLRNSLDRKASNLLRDKSECIANTYRMESVAFESDSTQILELRHRDLGSRHALKTVPLSRRDDIVLAQSLRREAETGLGFRHPKLVETSALLRLDDGRPGLLMPWHPVSLASLPSSQTLNQADAVNILQDVLQALEAMHLRGLVHCDVTPANIFLGEGSIPAAKLGDFGITIPIGSKHGDFGVESAGSPEFAAPEQMRGQAAYPCQDIYSVGKLIERMIDKIDEPSERLRRAALRCVIPQAELRPQTARDVLEMLAE